MARRVGDAGAEVASLAAFCDARSGPAYVHERIEAAGRMLALPSTTHCLSCSAGASDSGPASSWVT